MVSNEWQDKFEYSLGAREAFDIRLLKPTLVGCTRVWKTGEAEDRNGVDYIAELRGNARIYIDAKTRKPGARRYWRYGEPELALETWSVNKCQSYPSGKVGWTLSETTPVDYILYTFDASDTDRFYFLPFQLLRIAFRKNYSQWVRKYGVMIQRSEDKAAKYHREWTSSCVFVPASVVLGAVQTQMIQRIA